MKAFQGRYNRATYWFGIGFLAALLTIMAVGFNIAPRVQEVLLVFIAVPRLHDIGKSGWMVMWGVGLEISGIVLCLLLLPQDAFLGGMGIIVLIIAAMMVWLGCIPGQNFTNRFGEPPPSGLFGKAKGSRS